MCLEPKPILSVSICAYGGAEVPGGGEAAAQPHPAIVLLHPAAHDAFHCNPTFKLKPKLEQAPSVLEGPTYRSLL